MFQSVGPVTKGDSGLLSEAVRLKNVLIQKQRFYYLGPKINKMLKRNKEIFPPNYMLITYIRYKLCFHQTTVILLKEYTFLSSTNLEKVVHTFFD